MQEMINQMLTQAVYQELNRANKLYPQFHSNHEAHSVLQEEMEECLDEMNMIKLQMFSLWSYIKMNDTKEQIQAINELNKCSEALAIEVNQFRAMVLKTKNYYESQVKV